MYQSQRNEAYREALESIKQHIYPCSCTRKELRAAATMGGNFTYIYPGFCRETLKNPDSTHLSIRVKTHNEQICFEDLCQTGSFCQKINKEIGDFIVKRSDGLFAYQLAVIVDDAWQGITEIVRGADLFDNTPRQIFLQGLLAYPTPQYLHLPVVVNSFGDKLSKHNLSPEILLTEKRDNIIEALHFLGQNPPAIDNFSSLQDLWLWAIKNWDSANISKQMTKVINP